MNDVLTYIEWRGDLSFSQSGFNEVDNLIFSLLSYPQYEADEISVSEFARRCKLSRPSIYKYTRIVREVNVRKH